MKTKYINKTCAAAVLGASFAMGGCASIVNGTSQQLQITTPPAENARCEIVNSHGTWVLDRSPGVVNVHHAQDPLIIKCTKVGYLPAKTTVASHMSPTVAGNLLFGGVVGAVVDASDGAVYSYPDKVTIPMHKKPVSTAKTLNKSSKEQKHA